MEDTKQDKNNVQKVEPKIYKVAIGIPNEGLTKPEAYDNHLAVSFHLGKIEERLKLNNAPIQFEFYWHTVGRLLTPVAREQLVECAKAGNVDFIIMYDDDMTLPIDMFERLLEDMLEHPEIDILAPLAFMRGAPHFPVIYTINEIFDKERDSEHYISDIAKKYPKDCLVEADAAGFGAVCIRMSMVKKMTAPYFFTMTKTGEDIFFCHKAKKETGARIFIDTRIKLGHIGNAPIIDEAYYEKFAKEHDIDIPDVEYKYNVEHKYNSYSGQEEYE